MWQVRFDSMLVPVLAAPRVARLLAAVGGFRFCDLQSPRAIRCVGTGAWTDPGRGSALVDFGYPPGVIAAAAVVIDERFAAGDDALATDEAHGAAVGAGHSDWHQGP